MDRKSYYAEKEIDEIKVIEEWIYKVCKIVPDSNHAILDVGCGEGTYSAFLKKGGNEVWGLEISERAGEIAQGKIDRVIIQDAEKEWEVPSNYFDVVTMLRLLEHVFNYNFQLLQARRVLKENGQLIIFGPNMSILERIRLLFGRVPAYASCMEHIRQFTKPFLFKILKENGFKPIYCEGYKFMIPHIKLRIKLVEKFFPNSCPCLFVKAIKISTPSNCK